MKAYKKVVAILLAAITMLSLAGCGAKKSEAPAEEAPADKTTDNAAKEQQDSVTMYVRGLDTDENGLSITREYTLSSEDSEQV